jgi:predicted RND superfamily exporter protein
VLGFGAFSVMGFQLTAPIAVIGAMLAGMAIDYALHFLSHYHQMGHPDGVAARMIKPLLAAFITTATTFAIIALSGVHALRDFALLGMMGLGFSLIASVTLLPAILSLMHRRHPTRTTSFVQPRINFNRPLVLIARGPTVAMILGLLLLAVLSVIILSSPHRSVRLDPNIRAMHPQPNMALTVQDRLTEQFGLSPEFLVVHQQADTPEHLIALSHRVRSSLLVSSESTQSIRSMLGLADLLVDPDTLARRQQALQAIPPDEVLASFRAAVDDSIFEPSQFKAYEAFLTRMLRPNQPPTIETLQNYPQLAVNLLPRDSASAAIDNTMPCESLTFIWLHQPLDQRDHRQAVIHIFRDALKTAANPDRNERATLTGISVVAQDTEHVIASSLLKLSSLAAVGVLAIVLLTFRSVRDALLALLPVVMSIATVLAVMRVTDTGFNLINLIGLPLLVGVSVDYGIFLVSSARHVHDTSLPLVQRMGINAHASSLCCITTILGFGSIITAGTPAIASLGLVLCSGMIGSMAGALLLTAPILLITSHQEARS